MGTVSKDFTDDRRRGELVHGNELLFKRDAQYPTESRYGVRQYTLAAVRDVLGDRVALPQANWPDGVVSSWDGFIGYLLLDALIGNTDRHHQNWGVLETDANAQLAPTFDHASSLGRELDDASRQHRLVTKDTRGDLRAYIGRGRSALFDAQGAVLHPENAFLMAARTRPVVGRAWLSRLRAVSPQACREVVERVPGPRMSDPARRFVLAFLLETRTRIEALVV